MNLKLYERYTREDAQKILAPNDTFTPNSGTWGLHGIINLKNGDYVFFVTLGTVLPYHVFNEGLTDTGVLFWQSQPHQNLKSVEKFINFDSDNHNLYLFIRENSDSLYVYLGTLKYLAHNPNTEKPVDFVWKIIDWDYEKASKILDVNYISVISDYSKINSKTQLDYSNLNDKTVSKTKERNSLFNNVFVDFETDYRRRNELGEKGEFVVFNAEKEQLIKARREDLAAKVELTRLNQSNIMPYDILSFTESGEKKYIEVKTTLGAFDTPAYISEAEVQFSRKHDNNYYLYRLYDYDANRNKFKIYIRYGSFGDEQLTPYNYKIKSYD